MRITLSDKPTHDLDYKGGMMSTWNKFCFTGGLIEVATILPGANNVVGLWPAVWTMGNLGRAGFGASLEGTVRLITMFVDLLAYSCSSGRTHMTRVMLAQHQTRPSMGYQNRLRLTATNHTTECFLIYLARDFRDALAQESPIPARCIQMEPTSAALRQRLTFSRHK